MKKNLMESKPWNFTHIERILDKQSITITGSREISTNLTMETPIERGEMIITTKYPPLKTPTEVWDGELPEISVLNARKIQSLPNGMLNFKHMALMAEQCWKH